MIDLILSSTERIGYISRRAQNGGVVRMGLAPAILDGLDDEAKLPAPLKLPTAKVIPVYRKPGKKQSEYISDIFWDSHVRQSSYVWL